MNVVHQTIRRVSLVGAAFGLLIASLLPMVTPEKAYALPVGGQVTSRSIKPSSSRTSATGVSYQVNFLAFSAHTVRGIIVDFCNGTGGSPIVGDATCAAPTAPFTVGASPTISGLTGITAGWTVSSLNSGRTLKLEKAAGDAIAANGQVTFTIDTVTNPGGSVGTYYGRVITYTSDTGDIDSYTASTPGSSDATDYGGFALSTANSLDVTAKVQESLIFCVMTTGANCAGASGTNIQLGDGNGVLSSYSTNYLNPDNTAFFNVASNAQGGVVVRLKGQNLCRVAVTCADANTANVINPSTTSGAMTCTADSVTTSVEQFGLRVETPGAGVTAAAPFNCAAGNHGFDTNSTNGVGSTYGATVASTSAPGDEVQTALEFMAKAATTTEAGIYTTSLNFIATGTY